MSTPLSDIDGQAASTLVCDYLTCQHCGVVDRDQARMRVGSVCRTCGTQSPGGRLAFSVNIHILVDLVQQSFHSTAPVGPIAGPQASAVGTIILFCTLREALLSAFLREHLQATGVAESLIQRMFSDNKLASQKFGPLFSSVVGCSWNDAVATAGSQSGVNFEPISILMREAASVRNEFLHEGKAWEATREFATSCINQIPQLVYLFVVLHNNYVHPELRNSPRGAQVKPTEINWPRPDSV